MSKPLHIPGPYTYDRQKVALRGPDGRQLAAVIGSPHAADPADCPACATGDLLAASWAFLAACTAERDTVTALDWLSSLLDQCDRNFVGLLGESGDRQALYTALSESCRLLADLRAAVRQAEGGQRV